jgi:hypothetical protein
MVNHGREPSKSMISHHQPWLTMVDHGQPWPEAIKIHDQPLLDMVMARIFVFI